MDRALAESSDWSSDLLPVEWRFSHQATQAIQNHRLHLLNRGDAGRIEPTPVEGRVLLRNGRPHVAPHPVFFALADPEFSFGNSQVRVRLAHHLLGLVASTGSERPLDRFWRQVPDVRSTSLSSGPVSAPLPRLEEMDRALLHQRVGGGPPADSPQPGRVDAAIVQVDLTRTGLGQNLLTTPLDEPPLADPRLPDQVRVRVAQTDFFPEMKAVLASWPRHPAPRRALWNLTAALPWPAVPGKPARGPELVVLPEVVLPPGVERLVEDTVRQHRYSILTGRYWVELQRPNAYCGAPQRWFTNEADLVLHLGRRSSRSYRIRKPLPAPVEYSLAKALSDDAVRWRVAAGRTWYCFVHPRWGGFTTGICSDLLDPLPYALMRGRIQHMFFSAFNTDVELYQAMTWTRSYENYANLVLTNHGEVGGSFAWTPRAGHGKKLLGLEGAELFVTADVCIPVHDVIKQQNKGWCEAVRRKADKLQHDTDAAPRWKTPPPAFRKRKK
ncbi:MAG: hypothetical protein VX899_25810 [Myxococcota bacterium]|nr:hypothetical protein [Myxococcota bacterium]